MADDSSPDARADAHLEAELTAVADAERDPQPAMGEGTHVGTDTTQPAQPLDPRGHEPGENYLGQDTVFTRKADEQQP